jgi:hypothetical protein
MVEFVDTPDRKNALIKILSLIWPGRLVDQDAALSRQKQGFDAPSGYRWSYYSPV